MYPVISFAVLILPSKRNIINDRGPVRSFMIMFLPFNAAVSTMALEAPVDSARVWGSKKGYKCKGGMGFEISV